MQFRLVKYLLGTPGCPQTHGNPPASASLGFQECATTPGFEKREGGKENVGNLS